MPKHTENRIVLWPEYFDSGIPRSGGRRVASDLAVPNPELNAIFRICQKLKLDPEIEVERSYPSTWFRNNGRVKIKPKYSKTKTIKMVAKRLKEKSLG
jgi:signal recognition particle subunit SRP19